MQITSIVPAEHKDQAQLLLFSFYRILGIDIARESIFSIPVGINTPTHYMFTIDAKDSHIEEMMKENVNKWCVGCKWAYPEFTTDPKVLLNYFSQFKGSYDSLLKLLKLKILKVKK